MATILEKLRQNAKIHPGKRLFTFISPKISSTEGFCITFIDYACVAE
jgi:hypothetical protein